MASREQVREDPLSRLAHRPRHLINGMIKVTPSPTTSSIKRSPHATASLGNLDTLPLELLHSIFSTLDLQALLSITKTCPRGIAVVESMPEYRDLIRHAPQAVAALAATELLSCHSAHTLHVALQSEQCASCGEYGAFLFLPTCERCCHGCLWRTPSLWAIPISQARKTFGLSAASAKRLVAMHSLPGQYWVRYTISRKQRYRLVSVRAAKQLAKEENASEPAPGQDLGSLSTVGRPKRSDYMASCGLPHSRRQARG